MNDSAMEPTLIFVGVIIILLLAAVLILLLRRDRRDSSSPSPAAPPEPSPSAPDPFQSQLRGRRIVLSGFDSDNKAVRFEFPMEQLQGQGIVIGRSRDAEAQLGDDLVGRMHARLYSQGERLFLENLSKVSTTHFNRVPVPTGGIVAVEIGSEIALGPKVKLRLSKLG